MKTAEQIRKSVKALDLSDIVTVAFGAMCPNLKNGWAVYDPDTEELTGLSLGQNEWIPEDSRIYVHKIDANVFATDYDEDGDILDDVEYKEYRRLLDTGEVESISDYLSKHTSDTFEDRFLNFLVWCTENSGFDWDNIDRQIQDYISAQAREA